MQSSVVLIPIINRCHHELPPFLKICLQNYSLPAHHKFKICLYILDGFGGIYKKFGIEDFKRMDE